MKTEELYQTITNTIIELLESVEVSKSNLFWNNIKRTQPKNIYTGNFYTGINYLYLSAIAHIKGYSTNHWLTFKEIQNLQAKIKKGTKATSIIYFKSIPTDKDGNETTSEHAVNTKRIIKYYYVFNVENVEGLPPAYYIDSRKDECILTQWEKDDKAEQIIINTGANIRYLPQNNAYYMPMNDTITLPIREQFISSQPFYSTVFHELTHWTGHESRLNRIDMYKQNKKEYAFEELVAELGSTFICSHLNFGEHITDSAMYIKSWLTALKNDNRFIFKASAQASKAANYILQFDKEMQEAF